MELHLSRHLLIGSLSLALLAGTASADTLREALVSTYATNPTITAQREALRSTDATVAIARAAGRPNIGGTLGVNRDITQAGVFRRAGKGPFINGGVDLNYPIFSGGSVRNSIEAAKTRVEAGRATLRAVEGDVFTEAVAAYMDVIRDRAIVELNNNQVRVLTTNLEATRDRFQIGDITRTDVAQSEARLSLGARQSGDRPGPAVGERGKLSPHHRPPPRRAPAAAAAAAACPTSPDQAVQIALANNPDLIAITRQADAARFDVRTARAGRLPTVSAIASGDYSKTLGGGDSAVPGTPTAGTATTVGLSGRIPIYQGGLPAARIRQAQALEGQTLEQRIATERAVVANTRSAFATYQAAQNAITSNNVAVSANELALEGARAENSVGTRTILDVLNAEQELLNAQVQLVSARRDAYVAGFQLLNAMGQAEADDLGLGGGPLYDPLGNYRSVAGNWNDWAGDPRHEPVATRTVTPQEEAVTATPPAGVTPAPR